MFRAHHALFDGVSLIEVSARLTGYLEGDVQLAQRPAGITGKLSGLSTVARGIKGYLRRYFPLAGRAFTPGGLTGERRLNWAHIDTNQLDAAARRHGVGRNHIYLAALASALRN